MRSLLPRQAVMEVDQEKVRLEAESEMLADQEMTPEVEARLVSSGDGSTG